MGRVGGWRYFEVRRLGIRGFISGGVREGMGIWGKIRSFGLVVVIIAFIFFRIGVLFRYRL